MVTINLRTVEALLDAAEAVLDSDCGPKSLAELAAALHDVDSRRDYRAEFPDPDAAEAVAS